MQFYGWCISFAVNAASGSGNDGVASPKKAVPPVPARQSLVSDATNNACIVSKKLNVQLFKGDSLATAKSHA